MLGATDEGEEISLPVKVTMWVVFILATLISQVIMFNTLIAILGDTFSRIMEKRVHYSIKAKAEMYADFMYWVRNINCFNDFTRSKYLYVVRPVDDEEDQEWEGAVTTMKKKIENMRENLSH